MVFDSFNNRPVPLADALPPKLAPTQRIIEARGDVNCVCGRPAISCGYCSAECLEREEAKAEAATGLLPQSALKAEGVDPSLAVAGPDVQLIDSHRELLNYAVVIQPLLYVGSTCSSCFRSDRHDANCPVGMFAAAIANARWFHR